MSDSRLALHNPKFNAKLTTLEALQQLPTPLAIGPMHKPVPHAALVEAILAEIDRRGFEAQRQQLALSAKNAALFGVIDIAPKQAELVEGSERGLSFGFRNSTDQSMAIKAVAGSHVFVCDNLVLSGSMFAIHQKNTTGVDLGHTIATGFDKFLQHAEVLDVQIARLQGESLTDTEAKRWAFDVFAARIVPSRLFDDVERFYFHPADEMTDCQPRSLWGLHNAFTRAMRDLSPVRLFGASVALGNLFGIKG